MWHEKAPVQFSHTHQHCACGLCSAVSQVPKDVTASYPGGWDGPDSQRVTKPRHAVDFDPLEWFAIL